MNVLTAYSAEEAVQTLERFPNVDGIVLDSEVYGTSCKELIDKLRTMRQDIPVITVSPRGDDPCGGEQHHVSSYDPQDLLEQLHKLCPQEMDTLDQKKKSSGGH